MGAMYVELLVVCAPRETTLRRETAEFVGRLRAAGRRMCAMYVELSVVCAPRETTLRQETAEFNPGQFFR